jgi:HAD superfamily phosphoserine phosphatase-like hydrolase
MKEFEKPTAYFDFDDTVIFGDSILYWHQFLYQHRPKLKIFVIVQWFAILLWLMRILDSKTLKCWMLLPTAYLTEAERQVLGAQFAQTELPKYQFKEIQMAMQKHKQDGLRIVLLSASADFYLPYVCQWLPVDHVVGTSMNFPSKGWWRMPTYVTSNFKGRAKADYLNANPQLFSMEHALWGYSDHYSDKYLLEWTQNPIAVEPSTKLKRYAQKKGWTIVHVDYPHKKVRSKRDRLSRLYLMLFCWITRSPKNES